MIIYVEIIKKFFRNKNKKQLTQTFSLSVSILKAKQKVCTKKKIGEKFRKKKKNNNKHECLEEVYRSAAEK